MEYWKKIEALHYLSIMSNDGKERLIQMCCDSLKAFKSVMIESQSNDEVIKDLRGLFNLITIEATLRHHEICAEQTQEKVVRIAHNCASITIRKWIESYERELTLEENLELWKMQKL